MKVVSSFIDLLQLDWKLKSEMAAQCTTVSVFHLTAPEVLAQLHALSTITEASETPGSVQTLLCTHTCQALIHI